MRSTPKERDSESAHHTRKTANDKLTCTSNLSKEFASAPTLVLHMITSQGWKAWNANLSQYIRHY